MARRFRFDFGKAGLSGLFLGCSLLFGSAWSISTAVAEPVVLEVAHAEVGFDQRTSEPIVVFAFTEPSKRRFAELTTQNVGRIVEFRIDGRVVMRPVIRQPILGGMGQIMAGLSVDQARDIANRLSSGAARLEVEVQGVGAN